MIGLALRYMVEYSFFEAQGVRFRVFNVFRVGLVFIDGRFQDDILVWAARVKEEGEFGAGRIGLGLGWTWGGGFFEIQGVVWVFSFCRYRYVRRGRG